MAKKSHNDDIPEARKRNMRAIKRRNTKPELAIKGALDDAGIAYLEEENPDYPRLPGKPDIVLSTERVVIFVNGCFWHKHSCRYFKWPKTREEFWREKIEGNSIRDKLKQAELLDLGWRSLVIWECCLKGKNKLSGSEIAGAVKQFVVSKFDSAEVPGDAGLSRQP